MSRISDDECTSCLDNKKWYLAKGTRTRNKETHPEGAILFPINPNANRAGGEEAETFLLCFTAVSLPDSRPLVKSFFKES